MKKGKWAIAIVLPVLAAAACVPLANVLFAARLASALLSLASGSAGNQLSVQETKIQRKMKDQVVEALVYRPAMTYPKRALILVPGISELGCYHPRLMALCRYLADKGFLVVTPDIVPFREFEISAEPIDQIEFWFRQVPTIEGGRQASRTGLAGISFSASLALIAAAHPGIRKEISFFLGIGPYFDLQRCFRWWFAAGPLTVGEGYYPTRFYAKWIIMNAALGMLPARHDREFLHEVLIDLLLQKKVPAEDSALTPEGKRWYRLAVMRENQTDQGLSQAIDAYLSPILFRQLDPKEAAKEVRCPVFLLHGAYDDLIPPEEGRDLQANVTGAPCYLLVSPFLTHTHPLDKSFTIPEKAEAVMGSLAFFYRFASTVR